MSPLPDLRDAHATVSAALDAFPLGALDWHPAPDRWSATGVLEHLLKTERGCLFAIQRQVAAGDNRRDLGPTSPPRVTRLLTFLQSGGRTQVPEGAARFVAPTGAPYADLRAEWDGLDTRWHEALASVPPDLTEAGLVSHPVSGPLTAANAARFVGAHARHHLSQLRRLREADGFPSE
ncbi:MAG: DinB family protein [Bacteroidota bacterium]